MSVAGANSYYSNLLLEEIMVISMSVVGRVKVVVRHSLNKVPVIVIKKSISTCVTSGYFGSHATKVA